MSAQYEHESFLRAALHAAADTLDPRADGLDLIRTRLNRSSPALLRARAMWNEIFMRAPAALQDGSYWLASTIRDACVRFDRAITPGRHRSRAQSWLRPVAVMAVTLFIVAAGTYTAITASNFIFPSNSGSQSSSGNVTAGNSGGPAPGTPVAHSSAPTRRNGSTPAASCAPTAQATPAPAASPADSPTDSPTPTATPTDTSSSTDTASPSDTGTSSPDPTDSVSPSPTENAGPTTTPTGPAASASPCAAN
jgi:hypothetical protein